MPTTVKFDPGGGPLTAKAVMLGNMIAAYEMSLREKGSSLQTELLKGDNANPEDDTASLPTPVAINDGRRVVLYIGFSGEDHEHFPDYKNRLEIYQDGDLKGYAEEKGTLTGGGQTSLFFILLKAD